MPRIVVVEDEALILTMLQLNLKRQGYEVVSFTNAEAMLEWTVARKNPFDLMLLDIMLPGMNGDQALRMLREQGVSTPVLMLTARHDVEIKVDTLDRGADDYVTKPFDMNELLARIRARLRRGQHPGG